MVKPGSLNYFFISLLFRKNVKMVSVVANTVKDLRQQKGNCLP